MGTIKDAINAMNKVVLLNDKVERTGIALSEFAKELRDHDRRLIKLETMVEIAQAQQKSLPKE